MNSTYLRKTKTLSTLEKGLQYYRDNEEALAKKYKGKFLIIKGNKVMGAYKSFREAVDFSIIKDNPITFIAQPFPSGPTITKAIWDFEIIIDATDGLPSQEELYQRFS